MMNMSLNSLPNSLWRNTRLRHLFFGLIAALVVLFPIAVDAATLSLNPGTGVYRAGDTFTASVVVNTRSKAINAAEGTLSFNPQELSVVGITKGSIFSLWAVDPTFSNSAGTITFGGGSPTGYTGSNGVVLSITFRTTAAGSPRVSFTKGSVLAADGRGTNILTDMSGGSYTISARESQPVPEVIEYVAPANTPAAPTVRSSTHPDPQAWHTAKTALLSWTLPSGITGVRTLLSTDANAIPTKVYDDPISSIEIPDLPEGVSYFHIQLRNEDGWGRVARYRLAVDSVKPTQFDIALIEGSDLTSPQQTLALNVEDETSAVRRFLVQIDGAEPFEYIDETGSSTITLPELAPGYHSIIIEAFDEAGNSTLGSFSFTILAFDRPEFTEYPTEINEEVIPVIKGQTRPNSIVTISLTKLGSETKTYELQSDQNGVFTFIPESTFTQGVYELVAIATDQYGAKSDPSERIRIAVQAPGYIQIGSMLVSFLSILIPLGAMLALLILGFWYVILSVKRLRGTVRRESKEAGQMLQQEFTALREMLRNQESLLVSSRKTKQLTKAEATLIETLQRAFDESEARVAKEIGDVTQLVVEESQKSNK